MSKKPVAKSALTDPVKQAKIFADIMATPDSRVQKAPSAPVAAAKTAVKEEPKKAPEVPKITVTMDDAVIAGLPAKATNSALSKKPVAKSALTDPV